VRNSLILNNKSPQKANQGIWDNIYTTYERTTNIPGVKYPNEHLLRFLLSYKRYAKISQNQKIRVLELGFGPITQMIMMHKLGFMVEGLEVSIESVRRAKEAIKERKLEQFLHVGTYEGPDIPFEDKSFDIIVGLQCVYYNLDQSRFVSECSRVLKDNGVIFFSFFSPRHGYMKYISGKPGGIVEFTKEHPNPQLVGLKSFLFSGRRQFEQIYGKFFKIDVGLKEYDLLEVFQSWFFLRGQKLTAIPKERIAFTRFPPRELIKNDRNKKDVDLISALKNNINSKENNFEKQSACFDSLRYPNEQIVRFIARRKSRMEGNHLVFHIGKEVSVTMASESNALEIDFQSLANIMMMKDHGYNAFGISISNHLVFQTKGELRRQGLPEEINIESWDGLSLPFPSDYFDIVVSSEAAYCQPDQRLFAEECFRVTKPDGEIFLFYLSPCHGYTKYAKSMGSDLYQFSSEHPSPQLKNMIVYLPSKKTLEALWSPFFKVKVGIWEYDFDSVFSSFFVVYGKKVFNKEKP